MVRKLKYHERKLLKKVDFINWEGRNLKEIAIMRKYHITRTEYTRYNGLCHSIRLLAEKISSLPKDEFRIACAGELIEKLYFMGLINTKSLKKCAELSVKSFCHRRLPVFMIKSKMFNGPLDVATRYCQHGHVRIGPNIVRDPAFFITREQEDFITWTDKFRGKIDEYNNERDDYVD